MAVVTFLCGGNVEFGFALCYNAVMTFAAIAENFVMINTGYYGETKRCMAGFTRVGGGYMVR
jgi:hypothetical protein